MELIKDFQILELINNKRVAIVGPAKYLSKKNIGDFINNFDIVCRLNYLAPQKHYNQYGNRTDIMFYNCSSLSLERTKKHFEEFPNFGNKLKLVICPVVKAIGKDPWTEWPDEYVSNVVSNFAKINIYNNNFYWVGLNNYKYLYNMIKCREPNSGILAILLTLLYGPKELFITGITFYKDVKNKDDTYFSGYANRPPNWTGLGGHPQKAQIEFFKNYMLSQNNVTIDSYLQKLLKTKHKMVIDIG